MVLNLGPFLRWIVHKNCILHKLPLSGYDSQMRIGVINKKPLIVANIVCPIDRSSGLY